MSLDFAALDQSGTTERTISIGVDVHQELVNAATASDLAHLLIFSNYYEDADVPVNELPALDRQVKTLRDQIGITSELRGFLNELDELVASAMASKRALVALAD